MFKNLFASLKNKKGIAVLVGAVLIVISVVLFGFLKGKKSEEPSED
jgi:hypothetical protein